MQKAGFLTSRLKLFVLSYGGSIIIYLVAGVEGVVLPRMTVGHSPDLHTDYRWEDHQNAGTRVHQNHCSAAGKMARMLAAMTKKERYILSVRCKIP